MNLRNFVASAFFAATALIPSFTHAGLINWTAQPSSYSITLTSNGTTSDAYYNAVGRNLYPTFYIEGIADTAGDYSFDWVHSGAHYGTGSFAILNAFDGDNQWSSLVPLTSVDGSFSFSGTHTFTGVTAGEKLTFVLMPHNGTNSLPFLGGHLYLTQTSNLTQAPSEVPEPASLLLVALGLFGLVSRVRRV